MPITSSGRRFISCIADEDVVRLWAKDACNRVNFVDGMKSYIGFAFEEVSDTQLE